MKIFLLGGPCSRETYEVENPEQDSVVIEHAEVEGDDKITKVDRTEYVRTLGTMPDGSVIFTVKRDLPGKII
jgi:hypothetical protein